MTSRSRSASACLHHRFRSIFSWSTTRGSPVTAAGRTSLRRAAARARAHRAAGHGEAHSQRHPPDYCRPEALKVVGDPQRRHLGRLRANGRLKLLQHLITWSEHVETLVSDAMHQLIREELGKTLHHRESCPPPSIAMGPCATGGRRLLVH